MTRGILLGVAAACVAVALIWVRPVATPGPFERDFEAYWSAGTAWNAHEDPYSRDVWRSERTIPGVDATRDELLPFVGPPATLLLFGALARLPYDLASKVWWAVLVLAGLSLLHVLALVSRARLDVATGFALLLFAVGFGPVTSDLALGQIALIALLGACVLAVGPSISGALAATLQPNVALGIVAVFGLNRTTLAFVWGLVAAYVAGALAMGPNWIVTYARLLAEHAAAERFDAIQIGAAPIAYGFGASPGLANAIGIVVAVLAIAAAVAIATRVRERFVRFAAFSALAPFVAGFFHEHDLIAALPAAVLCAFNAKGLARAAAAAGATLIAVDWLGLAQRPSGILQSALLGGALLAAFTALGPDGEERSSLAALAIVVPLFAIAAWTAAQHPVPVWPDQLGAFHAAPGAAAAQVWHDEQQAAGLLDPSAPAAFLRSLSLAGCAIAAAATATLATPHTARQSA